ncbi:MAG TPA: hypothetical protein VFA20_01060 [Myxococcaceae bacterium]|nr:hypothetical protein [Myxococcaceae bacterium]
MSIAVNVNVTNGGPAPRLEPTQAEPSPTLSAVGPGHAVLVIGGDLLETCRKVAAKLGTHGRIVAVHPDAEEVRKVQRWTAPGEIKIGFHAVDEDLRVSREAANACVREHAPTDVEGLRRLNASLAALKEQPLVADGSVDVALVDGLSELPTLEARLRMLKEIHRVLRRGGTLELLDVAADEPIAPSALQGVDKRVRAVESESQLLASVAAAGLYGVTLVRRDKEPWKTAGRAELRRVSIRAYKGKEGACWDHHQAVIYRGPFSKVEDDDGHVYFRGQAMAVCKKTFDILTRAPYSAYFEGCEPVVAVVADLAQPFPCNVTGLVRDPGQLKGRAAAEAPAPVAQATPAPAPQPVVQSAAPAAPARRVRLYGRGGAPTTPAAREFVQALSARLGAQADVQFVDLDTAGEGEAVPSQLRLRLALGGDESLPAIAVDGVLAAVGGVPDLGAVDRLLGKGSTFGSVPLGAKATQEMKEAMAACCGPEGCC